MATIGKRKPAAAPAVAPAARPVLRSTADFARYVGLARTTVSRVLNGQPGLKRKTIDRVNRALAETGFTPNAYALHLKGKRTAMIGVCLADIAAPLAVRKLAALQRALRERGLSSLIEIAGPEPGASRDAVRRLLSLRVEAVVLVGAFPVEEIEARIAELVVHGTPHLVLEGPPVKRAHAVALDRAAGMAAMTAHLLAQGHRTLGLLGFPEASGRHDGVSGVRTALASAGLDFGRNVQVIDAPAPGTRGDAFEYGRSLAGRVAALPAAARPTALLAYDDVIALGALRGLQEAGAKLARGIVVTGFGHHEAARLALPALASLLVTMDPEIDASTAAAVELLLEGIDTPGRTKPTVRWITPRLVALKPDPLARM